MSSTRERRIPAPRRGDPFDGHPDAPPSSHGSGRGEKVVMRPGPVLPLVTLGAAAAAGLVVAGLGVWALDLPWSVFALLMAIAGVALAVRRLPLVAAAAVIAAVACWAFATRSLAAEPVRLVVANLAFAVAVVGGFGAALWVDKRSSARDAVRAAIAGRRWFGTVGGEPEPALPALERIPSALFFASDGGRCAHLVVAGRRVALVAATVWPRGRYGRDGDTITRDGRPFGPGTADLAGVLADLATWTEKLPDATCRAYLVAHPANPRAAGAVTIDPAGGDRVEVLPAAAFIEAAGGFLAADAHTVRIDVVEALLPPHADANPGIG